MPDACNICDRHLSDPHHRDGLPCCPFCGEPMVTSPVSDAYARCESCSYGIYKGYATQRAHTTRETALAKRVAELEDRLIALNHAYYSDDPRADSDFRRLLNEPVKEQP